VLAVDKRTCLPGLHVLKVQMRSFREISRDAQSGHMTVYSENDRALGCSNRHGEATRGVTTHSIGHRTPRNFFQDRELAAGAHLFDTEGLRV
jgi:hypothetical protein